MSLESSRKKIRDRIRYQEINRFISNTRTSIIDTRFQNEFIERKVLQAIQQYQQSNTFLTPQGVDYFIRDHPKEFSEEFKNSFCRFVIEHQRQEYFACLILLIQKSSKMQVLNQLNLVQFIHILFRAESIENCPKLELKVALMSSIFHKRKNIEEFLVLENYRSEIQTLGIFNKEYLKLIARCSKRGILLPSPTHISNYLQKQVNFYQNKLQELTLVCEILVDYYKNNISLVGQQKLLCLLQIANHRDVPQDLVEYILNFIKEGYQHDCVSKILTQGIHVFLCVFCQIALVRTQKSKNSALELIDQMFSKAETEEHSFTQKYKILDMVVILLQHDDINNELTFTLLCLLTRLFKVDSQNTILANQLGITEIVDYYSKSRNVRVADLAQLIIVEFLSF